MFDNILKTKYRVVEKVMGDGTSRCTIQFRYTVIPLWLPFLKGTEAKTFKSLYAAEQRLAEELKEERDL